MAGQVQNRMSQQRGEGHQHFSMRDQLEHPVACMEQTVRENPLAATMAAFGLGLGLGAVIGSLLAESTMRQQRLADSMGRRMLDSISDYVPDAVQKQFHR